MYHFANVDLCSSRKDHRVPWKKEGKSKMWWDPEQKFAVTTGKPSLFIHLGVLKVPSRIAQRMFFVR